MRKQVPFLIATIMGLAMVVQFFVPAHGLVEMQAIVLLYGRIIGAFALILGIVSLIRVNWVRVKRKSENWPYALITIIGFIIMFLAGGFGGFFIEPEAPAGEAEAVAAADEAAAWDFDFGAGIDQERNPVFGWLFNYVFVPMDATIFALLAFYVASAAYRAMRARDLTAGLLLGAAVIVMLGRASLASFWWDQLLSSRIDIIPTLGEITEWLMVYPNTAAKRGVYFGVGLAALGQAIRILVGLERPYMAGTSD
ncbi:MAG: hypothetical protein GF320_16185 [Armatimonadia bacterium]|nr:hypothetical protein [Armatimonadia bacterium]